MIDGYEAICPICGRETRSSTKGVAKRGVMSHIAKSQDSAHSSYNWDNLPEITVRSGVNYCDRCRKESEPDELIKVSLMGMRTHDFCKTCWDECNKDVYSRV